MTRFILLTAAVAVLFVFAVIRTTNWPQSAQAGASSTANSERIFEDDPRWDCKTMGNGVCGRDWWNDPRYQEYSTAFACFAEVRYAEPHTPWGETVMRCIPHVSKS